MKKNNNQLYISAAVSIQIDYEYCEIFYLDLSGIKNCHVD